MLPWLIWNSHCRSDWSWACRNPPVFVFWVLGLQVCTTCLSERIFEVLEFIHTIYLVNNWLGRKVCGILPFILEKSTWLRSSPCVPHYQWSAETGISLVDPSMTSLPWKFIPRLDNSMPGTWSGDTNIWTHKWCVFLLSMNMLVSNNQLHIGGNLSIMFLVSKGVMPPLNKGHLCGDYSCLFPLASQTQTETGILGAIRQMEEFLCGLGLKSFEISRLGPFLPNIVCLFVPFLFDWRLEQIGARQAIHSPRSRKLKDWVSALVK